MQSLRFWLFRASCITLLLGAALPILRFAKPFLGVVVAMASLAILLDFHTVVAKVPHKTKDYKWLGCGLLVAALCYLEYIQPGYFFRSDNKVQFFPVLKWATRSFFEGVFPTWNPYQFLGMPLIEPGLYALTYPITYISYLIARFIFGNDAYIFTTFAGVHLLAGYFLMERLIRAFGVRSSISTLSAVTFVLSGPILIGARDWFTTLPTHALWLTLIFTCYLKWLNQPNAVSGTLLGAAAGVFLHAGNVQMWFYIMLLLAFCGILSILSGRLTPHHWKAFFLAVVAVTLLVVPLLIPSIHYASQCTHQGGGEGILHRLNALLLPAPFVKLPHPNNWGAYAPYPWTSFFFVGYILVLTALIELWSLKRSLFSNRCFSDLGRGNIQFYWCLILVFLIALGPSAPYWQAFQMIPKIKELAQPFKFLVHVAFFVAIAGSLGMERVLSHLSKQHEKWGEAAIAGLSLIGLLFHVPQARVHYDFYDNDQMPVFPSQVASVVKPNDRLASLYGIQPSDPRYFDTMPFNIPTLYRVLHFGGMDALAQVYAPWLKWDNPDGWRAYGVRWLLASPEKNATVADLAPEAQLILPGIYEIKDSAPLVSVGKPRFRMDGMDLMIPMKSTGPVTLGFLWHWAFKASINGKNLPIEKDEFDRVVVIPEGPGEEAERVLQLRYEPLFLSGYWYVALNTLLLGLLLAYALRSHIDPHSVITRQ